MKKRAPVIGLAEQHNPLGVLDSFLGKEREADRLRVILARRTVSFARRPERAVVKVTTDGKYRLFLNGTPIARGPVRCNPLFQRYDEIDISDALREGANTLALLVRVEGRDTAQYQRMRGAAREIFGDGAIWVEGEADGDPVFDSGPEWRLIESDAWDGDAPIGNSSLGRLECFDAAKLAEDWTGPDFDDTAWTAASALKWGGDGPETMFGGMAIAPFPLVLPRIAPRPVERPLAPARIAWAGRQRARTDLSFDRAIYEEPIAPDEASRALAETWLRSGEPLAISPGADASDCFAMLVEFPFSHAGFPAIEFDAAGGEIIDMAFAEMLPEEFADGRSGTAERPEPEPTYHGSDANVVRIVARPGRQRFEKQNWVGYRWLHLVVRGAGANFRIRELSSARTHQPFVERGAIRSRDDLWPRVWTAGLRTLEACAVDTWMDCPSREQRQWLGDVAVEFPAGWAAYGRDAAPLTRQFLEQAAESQRPDGLTEMFAPGDFGINALLIPDWTLQWIGVLYDYVMRTGEHDLARDLLPSALRAHRWFENHVGANGLLADIPYWTFFDWAGLGRTGEATAVNALWAGTLLRTADLAERIGDAGTSERLRVRAAAVAEALNDRAWDAARGVYVDVVDPASGEREPRVSQHANALMILHDLAPRDRWDRMIAWCADRDKLKLTTAPRIVPEGETLHPDTDCVAANTFFVHFVVAAWVRAGSADLGLQLLRDRVQPMMAAGATTLWESYAPTASLCHGFSCTPLHHLTAGLFGIAPSQPGFERVRLVLQGISGLGSHGCDYPLGEGLLSLEYTPDGDGARITLSGINPACIDWTAAPGWTAREENRRATATEFVVTRA